MCCVWIRNLDEQMRNTLYPLTSLGMCDMTCDRAGRAGLAGSCWTGPFRLQQHPCHGRINEGPGGLIAQSNSPCRVTPWNLPSVIGSDGLSAMSFPDAAAAWCRYGRRKLLQDECAFRRPFQSTDGVPRDESGNWPHDGPSRRSRWDGTQRGSMLCGGNSGAPVLGQGVSLISGEGNYHEDGK